jgi:tetratricopeptide (TPR) repeat protein
MKDPLQSEQTPYEVLELERGASDADIDRAFKQGLAKRGNVQKLMAARNALQRPAERALLDLFQYDPQVASCLSPNPLADRSVLELERRQETAAAWERQLRADFPDVGIAHSLAVLWYWWVLHIEGQQGSGGGPSLDEGWRRVIAYWAMLAGSEEFWYAQVGAGGGLASSVRAQAVERLRNNLSDLGQRYRDGGDKTGADRCQGLELLLTTEVRTAKEVANVGLRTAQGRFACGLLMLEQMGLLDSVKQQLQTALEKNPADEKLLALRNSLSPYASIAALIDNNKPQAALDDIKAKEKEEVTRLAHSFWEQRGGRGGSADSDWRRAEGEFRDKPEGKELNSLRARAFHCLARQQASLDKLEEALSSWELALKCQPDAELKSNIVAEIVSNCQAHAAALQQREPETAIAILEMGLKLAPDEKLRSTLAEILTQRGITAINEAQKKLEVTGEARTLLQQANEAANAGDLDRAITFLRQAIPTAGGKRQLETKKKGVAPEIMRMLEKGQADLKRAAELGSQRAKENVQIASQVIEQVKSGMAEPKKQLAQLLNARAVQNINSAMPRINWAMREFQPKIDEEVETFLAGRWPAWFHLFLRLFAPITIVLGAVAESLKSTAFWVFVVVLLLGPFIYIGLQALGKWFRKQVPAYDPRYGFRSPCKLCGAGASYTFKTSSGEHALCSSHARELEKITKQAPLLEPQTALALRAASSDLAEATSLDPDSKNIKENFRNVKQLTERFKDSISIAGEVKQFSNKAA